MTPRRERLSENEKVYVMCLLFPIFWPLIPVLLICDLGEWVREKFRAAYWRRRERKDRNDG